MTENETEYIELKVVGRCWTTFPNEILNEIHFQVNPTTQMGKLKRCYSERVGFHVGSLRFLLEGGRFNDDETPETLEMEQNDVIEVFLEQPNWGKSLPAFSKPEFIDLTISFDLALHRPIKSKENSIFASKVKKRFAGSAALTEMSCLSFTSATVATLRSYS